MKLYISVDMEGITGMPDYTYVYANEQNYERARKIMTEEANYVIEAAHQFGCKEILVNDSHSRMNNLLIDHLHDEAVLITGGAKPFSMVQDLDDTYDAAMFVGYHSRAGNPGVMSHSMIQAIRNIYINDHAIGEMGFNAYVAGYFGVPLVLVSGDEQTAEEAKGLIPGVTTAVVKESISRSAVKSLTPNKAGALLMNKVKEALENQQDIKPLVPPKNPELQIEFNNYGQAERAHLMPGTEIVQGTTMVRYQAKDILEAYRGMLVMMTLASQTTFS